MSGTDYLLTPNLGLYKPIYDHDVEMWGTHLNANADTLDAALSTGAGGVFLPLTGGTVSRDMTGAAYDANLTINATALGSGVNGPATAQTGLTINITKDGWNTGSAAVGELDGLCITGRQGGAGSDLGGILVGVQNTGTGFLAAHQYASSVVNTATNLYTTYIGTTEASWDPVMGSSGHVYTANVGSLNSAIYINNAPLQSAAFTGSISGTTLTASAITSGNLGTGLVVTGTGVVANTTITGQVSGPTSGAGTYSVNNSQSVASTAMTATYQASWTNYIQAVQNGVQNFAVDGTGAIFAGAATFNGATQVANGVLTVGAPALPGGISAYMQSLAGFNRYIVWMSGGGGAGIRWALGANATGEGGSNAGSDFIISNYTDTGGVIGYPLSIARASGVVSMPSGVAIGSPTIRSGAGAATGTQPKGSLWMRTDGAAGTTLYVSQGAGTWNAIAGV